MKIILVLVVLLSLSSIAKTWEESGVSRFNMFFSNSSENTIKSLADDSDFQGPYFVFNYSSGEDYGLYIKTKGDAFSDSIWIMKYWMDDSLVNASVELKDILNIADFRLLNLDYSTQSKALSSIMDNRIEGFNPKAFNNYKSLYILYKKDTSYYAYCVIGTGWKSGCEFFWSCVFQDDETLNFGKIPSSKDVDLEYFGQCPYQSLPSFNIRLKNNQNNLPSFNAKGVPVNETSSGISLQKGISKLNLKK